MEQVQEGHQAEYLWGLLFVLLHRPTLLGVNPVITNGKLFQTAWYK